MSVALRIIVVLLLVLGNALFVAAEYAIVTARRSRYEERSEKGSKGARLALELMDEPVRYISAVQVGITVCGILLGAVGEPLVSSFFDFLPRGVSFIIAFLVLTYLSVVLGELVPKAVTLQRWEPIGIFLARPLKWLGIVTYPLVWVLDTSARAVTKVLGVEPAPVGLVTHSEEEIRHIVAEAEDTGVIEAREEEMLYKVFDFADKEAHEVMVPRPQVVALSIDLPPQECLASLVDSPYTRYPVYRGTIDEIVGILHVRDLFSALYDLGINNVDVESLVRPASFVPETKDLASLLADFRRTNQHMAIVVDEYGAFEGIVTLEDLLEEIVGEIEDEYDLPDESVERLAEDRIRISGTFPVDDFNEQFKQDLPQEEHHHTVGGLVFGRIGRAPEPGDEVVENGVRFTVVETDGLRIDRLEAQFLPPPAEEEPETVAGQGT